ncbi:Hypothetical protein A7982_08520 [Minicystis rosea]|nr:Hypothetical protein A7982_08520 [Minicystis rosea]
MQGNPNDGEIQAAAAVPYPAAHPSMPQIPHHGGSVMTKPVIVTVTFPGDRHVDKLERFGEEVGSLDWWRVTVSPYGADSAVSGGNVRIAEQPPARMSDNEVEAWVARKIDDGTLPPPTDQTLYTLYYPSSTTVTIDQSAVSCQTFLGYHSAINYRGKPVAYTVINRCGGLDQVTETASHEFAEAASDPQPLTINSLGYMLLESNAWTLLGGENADMCAGVAGVREKGWALTRVWNNENAAVGQQPCLPVAESEIPYFNAGIANDTLAALPGSTVTTEVACYSFGPLPGPMHLGIQLQGAQGLRFGLDRRTCNNGDKVTMTISVPREAPHGMDYRYSLITKLDETTAHMWRGMVHVK